MTSRDNLWCYVKTFSLLVTSYHWVRFASSCYYRMSSLREDNVFSRFCLFTCSLLLLYFRGGLFATCKPAVDLQLKGFLVIKTPFNNQIYFGYPPNFSPWKQHLHFLWILSLSDHHRNVFFGYVWTWIWICRVLNRIYCVVSSSRVWQRWTG